MKPRIREILLSVAPSNRKDPPPFSFAAEKENDDGGKKDRFVYFTRWRGAVSPSPLIDDDDDNNDDDDDDDDDDSIPPKAKAFRSGDISYPIPLLTRSFYPVNAAIIPSLFEPSFSFSFLSYRPKRRNS